jgi:hypothetical protein
MDGASKAMTTLAHLNGLSPSDHNATPWVATPDGIMDPLGRRRADPCLRLFAQERRVTLRGCPIRGRVSTPVGVTDDVAAGHRVGVPWRRGSGGMVRASWLYRAASTGTVGGDCPTGRSQASAGSINGADPGAYTLDPGAYTLTAIG